MMTVGSIKVVMNIVRRAKMYQEPHCEQEIWAQVPPTCCAQLSDEGLWSIIAMFVTMWVILE